MVGDGSYLMLHTEIVTSLEEGMKLTIVVVDNGGFQIIRKLQMSTGSPSFGNELRFRDPATGRARRPLHPDRLRRQRRQPGRGRHDARPTRPSCATRWSGPRARRAPSSSTSRCRSTPPSPDSIPGGTCRWPRSPRSRPCARRGRSTSSSETDGAILLLEPPVEFQFDCERQRAVHPAWPGQRGTDDCIVRFGLRRRGCRRWRQSGSNSSTPTSSFPSCATTPTMPIYRANVRVLFRLTSA